MAEQEDRLIQDFFKKLGAFLAETRPVPEPCPVTEVIVRVGQAEQVRQLGGGGGVTTTFDQGCGNGECGNGGCCLLKAVGGAGALQFESAENQLIQRVTDSLKVSREQLLDESLHRLLTRLLSEELRRFARQQGIPEPPENPQ